MRRVYVRPGWGVVLLVVLALGVWGCSDGPPPEETLAELGVNVGQATQDQTDFAGLLSTYTTEGYGQEVTPELAKYQLFLTAKAADVALNQPEPPDTIETEVATEGDTATVSFHLRDRRGLFSVADVSLIEVHLVDTGAEELPWRINEITLER